MVVLDAAVGAVNPLILRALIDKASGTARGLVIGLASLAGGLALFDAMLSLSERRISAVIGEGLIYDMRSKVFRHIQSMPLAFFTRTQTGALISRLNNDVIGAQQAFTDLFSNVVGNLVTVIIVLVAMFSSLAHHPRRAGTPAGLPRPGPPGRTTPRPLSQRGIELNAEMNMVMYERFNVGRAPCWSSSSAGPRRSGLLRYQAGQVRDIGIHQAIYARLFLVALR